LFILIIICLYICTSKQQQTLSEHNKGMNKKRIEISAGHKKELVNKFRTTGTTVQQSLDYYNNSELAKKIRAGAKDLLVAEADKIEA
jgi:hypothetical protein